MIERDEYVQKLKGQIDRWSAEAARWEEKMKHAQSGMKAEYERQLEQFRARRDEAMVELRRLQSASADAWTEMLRGVDASVKSMQEAFERARRNFDKK
jgi:lipid II:glycine glycyltransferase (peptidoglycan interpeptide bridge formation enzyme)